MSTSYDALAARFARANRVDEASGWLHWDQSVTMPPGGASARAEQLAALAEISHELIASDITGDLLAKAEAEGASSAEDPWRAANFREMQRNYLMTMAIPADLVGALSRAKNLSETAWRVARPASDFALALPAFTELVKLVREEASALGEALGLSPYNALLEQYDPGRRIADIEPVFDDLRTFLGDTIPEIVERQKTWGEGRAIKAPVAAQREAAQGLLKSIGFDFDHGRLDDSLHPFSTGTPDDARITARWNPDDALTGMMAVLHEAGHAAYTRGQPLDWRGQPVGDDAGMAVHESQSLSYEMQAGRTAAMSRYLAKLLSDAAGADITGEAVSQSLLKVSPGYIRVDADEATYPLHVILRFELEQALISGELAPADLPAAWNQRVVESLALDPPDDRNGCLQDIHWYDGAFGYFPTYTLGAMAAAQLFRAASDSIGADDLHGALAKGDYAPLTAWMRDNVHGMGRIYPSSNDLLQAATGAPLSSDAFKAHIKARYLS